MTAVRTVAHAGLEVELLAPEATGAAIEAALAPFFAVRPGPSPTARVRLELVAGDPPDGERAPGRDGVAVAVDTSLYAHQASTGTRWELRGGHLVRIDATGTLVLVRRGERLVRAWQPDARALELDGIRALRGLFTQGAEAGGAVQLHAAGVVADGRGILVVGDMWQGKTTLLLELLSSFRLDQLSCDTTVVRVEPDGRLFAAGWPSPFSVSHGTLADHPELGAHFPPARRGTAYATLWAEGKKAVLTSRQVADAFGVQLVPEVPDLSAVLVVRFRPDEPTRVERLGDPARLLELLRPCYLGSRDPIYHDWLDFFAVDPLAIDANLERVARRMLERELVHEMTWAPSPTSLLKRVPVLSRAHPHLRRILF